ncbi:glutaredoxin family protein [Bacillus tianshenii]|nr:glutaredoxin family protein [Bacillus tianshenii]
MEVVLYSRKKCPLCDQARDVLIELQNEFPLNIKEVDIYSDDELLEKYQLMIPVVDIDGEQADYGMIVKDLLRNRLLEKNQ